MKTILLMLCVFAIPAANAITTDCKPVEFAELNSYSDEELRAKLKDYYALFEKAPVSASQGDLNGLNDCMNQISRITRMLVQRKKQQEGQSVTPP